MRNDYDLYVCELLTYAVHSTRDTIDNNVESLFTLKSLSILRRGDCVPKLGLEVHRQSLKYCRMLLMNHLLKIIHLPMITRYAKVESSVKVNVASKTE